jgi:hypothetical protein
MEVINFSETSVRTRSTGRHIPVDGILYNHICKSFNSYYLHLCLVERCLLNTLGNVFSDSFNFISKTVRLGEKKTVSGINCVLTFSPKLRLKQNFVLSNISEVTLEIQAEIHMGLRANCPLLLSYFIQTSNVSTDSGETFQYKSSCRSIQQFSD